MPVSQALLDATVAAIQSAKPDFTYKASYELSAEGAIPSSTAPTTWSNVTITDPLGGTNVPTIIPADQYWVVWDENIVNTANVAADARTRFYNGSKLLQTTPSLNANLVSLNTRNGLSGPMVYRPQSSLLLQQAPTSTAGTVGPYTNTFNVEIVVVSNAYALASI